MKLMQKRTLLLVEGGKVVDELREGDEIEYIDGYGRYKSGTIKKILAQGLIMAQYSQEWHVGFKHIDFCTKKAALDVLAHVSGLVKIQV